MEAKDARVPLIFAGKIRRAEKADWQQLKVIFEYWLRNRGEPLPDEVAELKSKIMQSLHTATGYYVAVAQKGSLIAGVMCLQKPEKRLAAFGATDSSVELADAYVNPAWLGRGVGTTIASTLEGIARAEGFKELLVCSGPRYRDSGWGFWSHRYGRPVGVIKDLYGPGEDAQVWRQELQS